MRSDKPDLQSAYGLKTPEDSKRLYADWAGDYDADFATREDYQLHVHTAQAFADAGGQGPVLDVGAGTGLCGAALAALGITPIDATDISAEMLTAAETKDIYRDLIEADLTRGLPIPRNSYAGVVSSGTFTTGHVGPQAIEALLLVARSGAQFALSVNSKHYQKAGFAAAFDTLQQTKAIHDLTLPEVRIYGDKAQAAHKDDTALIVLFKKT